MEILIFVVGVIGWVIIYLLNVQAFINTNPSYYMFDYIRKYKAVVSASFLLCMGLLILLFVGELSVLLSYLGVNLTLGGKIATAFVVGVLTEFILNLIRRKFIDKQE